MGFNLKDVKNYKYINDTECDPVFGNDELEKTKVNNAVLEILKKKGLTPDDLLYEEGNGDYLKDYFIVISRGFQVYKHHICIALKDGTPVIKISFVKDDNVVIVSYEINDGKIVDYSAQKIKTDVKISEWY